MNERIKELQRQAVEYANRKVVFIENPDLTISVQDVIDQKFAELIVQHCTYQCYLIGESGLAHELSDEFGFEFDFRKMMEDEDE